MRCHTEKPHAPPQKNKRQATSADLKHTQILGSREGAWRTRTCCTQCILSPQSPKAACLFQRTEETLKKERRLLKQRTQALRYGPAVLRDRKLLKRSKRNLIIELSGPQAASGVVLLPAGWMGRGQPRAGSREVSAEKSLFTKLGLWVKFQWKKKRICRSLKIKAPKSLRRMATLDSNCLVWEEGRV